MSQSPHASALTSVAGKATDVVTNSNDFFIIGLEDDFICLPEKADAYEKITNEEAFLHHLFERRSTALGEYEKAKNDYAKALHDNKVKNSTPYLLDMAARTLDDKRQALYQAHEKLTEEVAIKEEPTAPAKKLSNLATAGNGLKEIIVARKHGGTKKTLVRSKIVRNHFRTYRLRSDDDLRTGDKSFIKNNKIDWEEFKSQYKKSNATAKLKSQIPWMDNWIKSCNKDIVLAKYATALNHEIDLGKAAKINFSAEAQFCRAATSLAWNYEVDLRKGKFNTKLDGGVSFSLAECKSTASFIMPRDGIMLHYSTMYLGIVRLTLVVTGTAGVGASIAGALSVDIDASGKKITGLVSTINSIRSTEPGKLADLSELPGGKAGASASAFAGASVEATIAGAIEWKSPELTNGKESLFKAIATIKSGLAATAGIGAGIDYYYEFKDGVFRIFCKAALCVGIGAKGSLGFEVDSNQIGNFIICAYHQICALSPAARARLYSDAAQSALSMLTLEGVRKGVSSAANKIYDKTAIWYGRAVTSWREEESRVQVMKNILRNPDLVKYTIPLAKSQLINMLMNDSFWSHLQWSNYFSEWKDIRDGSTPRKRAIILVFTWVQSKAEFREIMKGITDSNNKRCASWLQGFNIVKSFLDRGEHVSWLAPYVTSDYDGNLQLFYDRLHETHPVGYPVVKNTMEEYLTRNDIAPEFMYPHGIDDSSFKEQLLAQAKDINNDTQHT